VLTGGAGLVWSERRRRPRVGRRLAEGEKAAAGGGGCARPAEASPVDRGSRRHGEDVRTARDEEAAAALLRACLYAGEGSSGGSGKKTVRGGEWSARRRSRATSIWWPEEEEDGWIKYQRRSLVPVRSTNRD